jgi:hypothetical protein
MGALINKMINVNNINKALLKIILSLVLRYAQFNIFLYLKSERKNAYRINQLKLEI